MSEYNDEWYPPRPPREVSCFEAFAISFSLIAAFFCGLLIGVSRP